MKVLTTASEIAAVEDEFEITDNRIDETYLTYDLNEWDDYAIEEAVQISESTSEDVEVVVASIGPERSEETIRQALAKGTDRAIRVWDDALASADVIDPHAKADILAAIVETEEPDLVLTGVQSGDDAWGATGVALARRIGYQWAAVVNALDLDRESQSATVTRELEGGVSEITEISLPAVLTIQTGINQPRYASLRGIRQAQSKPLEVRSLADLGIDADDVTGTLGIRDVSRPETESETTYLEGDPGKQAQQLAELLQTEGVVKG